MITTKSMKQLWDERAPAVLCYPTMMLPAVVAADALTWKTGITVVVLVSEELPANGQLQIFDPGRVLEKVILSLPRIVEEFAAAHPQQLRLLPPPEEDHA